MSRFIAALVFAGEAPAFGTDGVPATPRDGADVEIIGLLYSALTWLDGVAATQPATFPFLGVPMPAAGEEWTWGDWAGRVKAAFERCFYVPTHASSDGAHLIDHRYVNRRGIYKDTVGSSAGWPDYQLRPNQLIAMAVAPELFDPAHADIALATVERQLMGENQLGVKTLDPSDWAYRPNYDNNAATDRATAKGFNYHQVSATHSAIHRRVSAIAHLPLPFSRHFARRDRSGCGRTGTTCEHACGFLPGWHPPPVVGARMCGLHAPPPQ